ncbi:hypothetical protein Pmani_033353 [Petrolisthes manimaculis]|nr:hypothetical protein Pcinc_037863 [Petrolisthes cinctipes]KAK4293992.1 hypothetical protein Pmani_033353 [Petrolisthes manimaculis]
MESWKTAKTLTTLSVIRGEGKRCFLKWTKTVSHIKTISQKAPLRLTHTVASLYLSLTEKQKGVSVMSALCGLAVPTLTPAPRSQPQPCNKAL